MVYGGTEGLCMGQEGSEPQGHSHSGSQKAESREKQQPQLGSKVNQGGDGSRETKR